MKQIFTLLLIIFFFKNSYSNHIDENTAKTVAINFLINKTNSQTLQETSNLQLAYKATGVANDASAVTLFYVFNTNNNGFIIVSGDDNVTPILAYSYEGFFTLTDMPTNVNKWLNDYKNQISYAITHHISATTQISEEWTNLKNGTTTNPLAKLVMASVNPMIQTTWSQRNHYSALCPTGCPVGCVTTAVSQIMKYWNYPTTGSGFNSYNHSVYGTLSANFANTTYSWSAMPNSVTSPNLAVATLMYHVGVGLETSYDPQGSGAYDADVVDVLEDYFDYSTTVDLWNRQYHSDNTWMNLLKSELNAARPVYYSGSRTSGGHAFVADGYDVNDLIHFNWGWSGSYNGFFQINALNPSGGSSGNYNNHRMIVGIEPPLAGQSFNMKLYNYVTPSASIINYGQGFNVTTNITNAGTNTFTGDYCAAVFDNSYNFVSYTQTLSNRTLQGGYAYVNNLTFTTSAISAMTPGNYYIGIFYRPTGGSWKQVANNGNYTNLSPITVVNPNNIELYTAITLTPSTTFTQGTSASVSYNVKNYASTSFIGKYRVSLFTLSGTLAQTINTLTESNGLPAGLYYSSSMLFSTSSITVAPGTYNIMAEHNPNNTGWQLTGSSYYQNKKQIIVVAPNIQPDIYEVNDTTAQSYNLPISFTGNNASKNTVGSNFHVVSDKDYFKIVLPTGYSYTITPRIHDSYNSGNGLLYTNDARFSYSTDAGNTWSNTYDDVMTGDIYLNNGGTVYFSVAPYYVGQVGTYLLDMSINRLLNTVTGGISALEIDKSISIYPNPAKDFIEINASNFNGEITQINLQTIQGQRVFSENSIKKNETIVLPLINIADGVYFIRLVTSQGIITKKLVVGK